MLLPTIITTAHYTVNNCVLLVTVTWNSYALRCLLKEGILTYGSLQGEISASDTGPFVREFPANADNLAIDSAAACTKRADMIRNTCEIDIVLSC